MCWCVLVLGNYSNWLCSVQHMQNMHFYELKPEAAYIFVNIFKFHCTTMLQFSLSLSLSPLSSLHTLFRIHFTISSNFGCNKNAKQTFAQMMPNAECKNCSNEMDKNEKNQKQNTNAVWTVPFRRYAEPLSPKPKIYSPNLNVNKIKEHQALAMVLNIVYTVHHSL